MADRFSKQERSRVMGTVKSANTTPEIHVRKFLHRSGFRYNICRKDLPGKPDIVLPKYRTAIFVNGCFWHQHPGCKKSARPVTNIEFWDNKLNKNVDRDARSVLALNELGWKVIVIWECKSKNPSKLSELAEDIRS